MNSTWHLFITKALLAVIAAALVGGCAEETAPLASAPESTKDAPEKMFSAQFKK